MVKICQTGLLKLNFETRPKKRIFRLLPKISAGHGWSWNFFCQFPNPWALRLGWDGLLYLKMWKKSKSLHPTVQCANILQIWKCASYLELLEESCILGLFYYIFFKWHEDCWWWITWTSWSSFLHSCEFICTFIRNVKRTCFFVVHITYTDLFNFFFICVHISEAFYLLGRKSVYDVVILS